MKLKPIKKKPSCIRSNDLAKEAVKKNKGLNSFIILQRYKKQVRNEKSILCCQKSF
jgi:hypothetical protein